MQQRQNMMSNQFLRIIKSGNIKLENFIRFSSSAFLGRNYSTEPEAAFVLVERVENITKIFINRPENRNCVNLETARQLQVAFKDFENDSNSRVAVLSGKGDCFCAGLDLKEVAKFPKDFDFQKTGNYNPHNEDGVGPMGPSRRFLSKPVIAAISGYAVAGGLEIALMCDLRVVEESAILGVFCRRFGVPLIDGGTVRLPHLIGLSRAMDMILTGRPVSGKEALTFGLANRLVPTGTAVEQAVVLAHSLSKFPQECMNRDRESAYFSTYSAIDFESANQREMGKGLEIISRESVDGAATFVKGIGRHGSFN